MNNTEYFKLIEDVKNRQFNFIIGGRNVTKLDFFVKNLCYALQHYLGGFITYRKYNKYIEIIVNNDDIGNCAFTLYNDTIKYEKQYVIFVRLLEEYDALMRYKFRDYERRET